jgi:hypothetical protein
LLALVANDDCESFQREVLFRKLRLGGWTSWPPRERESVELFMNAVWDDCLVSEAGTVWVDELLCGLGNAFDDLYPFLTTWETCRLATGYSHLIGFIDSNSRTLLKRKHLDNAFWSDAAAQMSEVVDWLANQETVRSLEQIFAEDPSSSFANALASAIDRLTAFQQL